MNDGLLAGASVVLLFDLRNTISFNNDWIGRIDLLLLKYFEDYFPVNGLDDGF